MNPVTKLANLLNVTDQELADQLNTTPERIARLRKSASDTTVAELRDLATLAGLSVTEFKCLGDETSDELSDAVAAHKLVFWGYLRVRLWGHNEPLSWPISHYEAARLKRSLPSIQSNEFFELDTLDARSIRISLARARSVVLAELRSDAPLEHPPIWAPPEVYRAAKEWAEDQVAFEARNSAALRRRSLVLINSYGWTQDREGLVDHLCVTKLYHDDGRCLRIGAMPETLVDLHDALEFGGLTTTVVSSDGLSEIHVCTEHVAIADMPLNELLSGRAARSL